MNMASKKKVAMVQPPPSVSELPVFADPALEHRLLKALQKIKNNRAFTVVEYHSSWASVHFEGDIQPTKIDY